MLRRLFNALYEKLFSRMGLGFMALAVMINAGAMFAVDDGLRRLEEARGGAVQSRLQTAEILLVESMVHEAESAQRGFLYTGNDAYLAPLNRNKGLINAEFVKLNKAVADDPARRKALGQVQALVREKLIELDEAVAVARMGDKAAARAIVMSDRGKKLTEEIDRQISQFVLQEKQVLLEWLQDLANIMLAIRWGFAAVLLINALMILAIAASIMRSMAREVDRDRTDQLQHNEREAAEQVQHDKREAAAAAEVVQRATELRALSVHLLRKHEEERQTIARDLHDELGGTMSAIKMDLIMGRDAAAKHSDEKSVARLQRALAAVDSAVKFVRGLIENLRPTLLDNLGFEPALRAMVEQFSERTGNQCVISLPEGELNLTALQSTTLYRVCQEALTNIMKYAKAKKVTITLSSDGSAWTLMLADDGVGLEATKQHRVLSHGLLGMRERIVALGGTFDIRGKAGFGTTLRATFPVIEGEQPSLS